MILLSLVRGSYQGTPSGVPFFGLDESQALAAGVKALMKRHVRLYVLGVVFLLVIVAVAQSQIFAGTWHTPKSRLTGRANLSAKLVQLPETLSGSVIFVNPDGTILELPITKPEIKGNTLDFQTIDHGSTTYWSLTVTKNFRKGILKGSQHEMLIEEKVQRDR